MNWSRFKQRMFKNHWGNQVLAVVESWGETDKYYETPEWEDADVVTSKIRNEDTHKVVLDIDLPCELVESATKGHFHLYIDKEMEWYQYETLLWSLVQAGIVDKNYAAYSKRRGFTAVRLPWKPKTTDETSSDLMGWNETMLEGYEPKDNVTSLFDR